MVASGELAKGRARHGPACTPFRPAGPYGAACRPRGASHGRGGAIAEAEGADIIDINMGCPAKKVTGGYSGSALMRDLDHALTLIDAVVGAVKVPVTVKMRLGWDESALNAPILARRAEQAGVKMVTVHGRTRCQFYQGKADWRAIARVKEAVSIPVVANGDVGSPADAAAMLEQSGADAVMVGRAQLWRAVDRGADRRCRRRRDDASNVPANGAAMADYVVAHYEDMLSLYGVESGLRQARKHLGWYLDRHAPGVGGAAQHDHDVARPGRGDPLARAHAFLTATEFEPLRTAHERISAFRGRRGRSRPDRAQHHPPAGDHDRPGRHHHLRQCRRRGFLPLERRCAFAQDAGAFRALRQPDPGAGRSGRGRGARRSTNTASTFPRRASASRRSSTSTSRRCPSCPARSS